MTADLVPFDPNQNSQTDSWVGILVHVGTLAKSICDTDFVPKGFRGNAAATAAAILTGRELGIPPLTSLAHLHVIQGKVGMSAQLMRQLILSAGHELRYVETTETRCIVEGRRRGSEDWTRVAFTADQAKAARIDLGAYREDKLVARATSRLARRVFADCLGGVPYLAEELTDGSVDSGLAPTAGPPATRPTSAVRTAQRAPRKTPPPAPALAAAAAPPPHTIAATLDEPPLDDEPDIPGPRVEPEPMSSPRQLTAIATAMGAIDYRTREDQHGLATRILGRPIGTAKDITAGEAHRILDLLTQAQASGDPEPFLDERLPGVREATDA